MQIKKISILFFTLIAVAIFLTFVLLLITSGNHLITHDPRAIDFVAFYTGAKLFLHDPKLIYDLHAQQMFQQHVLPITKTHHIFIPFLNPPFVAILFVPFVFFNITTAYDVWLVINCGFVVMFCYVIWKQTTKLRHFKRLLFVLGTATFIPVLTSLIIGQLSILLCLVVVCSWQLLQRKKLFWSGICFSLLLIKPHFLLVSLLAFLIQRNKKFLGGFITGILFLMLISFLLVGEHGIMQYINLLSNASSWNTNYRIDLLAQHSVQTVLLILVHTTNLAVIRPIWYIICVVIIIPTVYVWRKTYQPDSEQTAIQWSLLIIVTLLTSPHTHFHDLSLLLLLPYFFNRTTKTLSIFFLASYLLQSFGYLFAIWTNKQSDPVWIICNVSLLIIFSVFLLKRDMLRYKL